MVAQGRKPIPKKPDKVLLAYNNRGKVFYKNGQFDKAIADFYEAAALRPSYIDAYCNLAGRVSTIYHPVCDIMQL